MEFRYGSYTLSVLAVAAFSAAGCGGSGNAQSSRSPVSSSPPTVRSPLESQFIARADAICGRFNTEVASARPAVVNAHEIIRLVPRNAALERETISELGRLIPPAGLERDWRQMIQYRRISAEDLVRLVRAERAGDSRAVSALIGEKRSVHRQLFASAGHAGFNQCSRVG
jgi:hypothetical protein